MVNLSNKVLRKELKINGLNHSNKVSGKDFTVYREYEFEGKKINIISFDDKRFYLELDGKKRCYIRLNQYLLALPYVKDSNEETLTFHDAFLYRMKDAESFDVRIDGIIQCGNCLVIDNRILAICHQARTYFLVVVNDNLVILPTLNVEQALRLLKLRESDMKRLVIKDADGGWSIQNGLILNPRTLEVPGLLNQVFNDKKFDKYLKTQLAFRNLRKLLQDCAEEKHHHICYVCSNGL